MNATTINTAMTSINMTMTTINTVTATIDMTMMAITTVDGERIKLLRATPDNAHSQKIPKRRAWGVA